MQEIIVYQSVNIKQAAVDNDNYNDFKLPAEGNFIENERRETKAIEFQAMKIGDFTFSCGLCIKKSRDTRLWFLKLNKGRDYML